MIDKCCDQDKRPQAHAATLEVRLELMLEALERWRQYEESILGSLSWRLTRPLRAMLMRWRDGGAA